MSRARIVALLRELADEIEKADAPPSPAKPERWTEMDPEEIAAKESKEILTKTDALQSRELTYRRAYEAGLNDAGLRLSLTWGSMHQAALNTSILTHAVSQKPDRHGERLRGEEMLGWLRAAAFDFGSFLRESSDDARFYSGGEARGFSRWLNEQATKEKKHAFSGQRSNLYSPKEMRKP